MAVLWATSWSNDSGQRREVLHREHVTSCQEQLFGAGGCADLAGASGCSSWFSSRVLHASALATRVRVVVLVVLVVRVFLVTVELQLRVAVLVASLLLI